MSIHGMDGSPKLPCKHVECCMIQCSAGSSECSGGQKLETSVGSCAQDNGFREGDHVRRIPFEVMVRGDKQPFYEETLEVRAAERLGA